MEMHKKDKLSDFRQSEYPVAIGAREVLFTSITIHIAMPISNTPLYT